LATGGKGDRPAPGSKSGANFSAREAREELEEWGVKMTPSRLVERWLVREDRSAKGGTKISSEASDVCGDGSSSTGVVPIIAPSFLAECRTRARSWLRRRLVVGGFLVARLIGRRGQGGIADVAMPFGVSIINGMHGSNYICLQICLHICNKGLRLALREKCGGKALA
jgi:hypothetical protein